MNLSNTYKVLTLIFIAIILLIFSFYKRKTLPDKVLHWQFSGPIQHISYDVKKYPWVTINNYEYNLYYTIWNFNVKLNKGDTLIKKSGDLHLKLIRPGTKDTISFATRLQIPVN